MNYTIVLEEFKNTNFLPKNSKIMILLRMVISLFIPRMPLTNQHVTQRGNTLTCLGVVMGQRKPVRRMNHLKLGVQRTNAVGDIHFGTI